MAAEEEKEKDQESAPPIPEEAAEAAAAEEEEGGTEEEKKERRYWPAAVALTLLVLSAVGFYALTGLRSAAHKMGTGAEYDQLSANSEVYDGAAGAYKPLDVFSGAGAEVEAPAAAAAEGPGASRINPALAQSGKELVDDVGASLAAASAGGGAEDNYVPGASGGQAEPRARGGEAGGQLAGKLRSSPFLAGGPGGAASRSKGGLPGPVAAFEGTGTLAGRASAQRETAKAGAPRQGGRTTVMDSLKGAFRATFYGARLSSQDSARGWVARAFDASPEATTAIEYDEKVRAKLDRVNPNSIPQFLRDQDVSAAEAKRLADSDVSRPEMDKEGTKEALEHDKDYQKKKMSKELFGSMLNGMFAGVSGTGTEQPPGDTVTGDDDFGDYDDFGAFSLGGDYDSRDSFADPDDVQSLQDDEMQDWISQYGFGGECGCTAEAPCCCMPQNGVGTEGDGMIGDFPPMDTDLMLA